MKMASPAVLPLIILFSFITQTLHAAAASSAAQPVLDVNGTIMRQIVNYNIVPVSKTIAGSVALTNSSKCPPDVILASEALGVSFEPVDSKKVVIRLSTDLNIFFPTALMCSQQKVWKLDGVDKTSGLFFVTTGGTIGKPGPATVNNWFRIEKYEESYKLVYCPSVCNNCTSLCKDVGLYVDHGVTRLALTNAPLKVRFELGKIVD